MYCQFCGRENSADANFCAHCGRPLLRAKASDAPTGALRVDEVAAAVETEAGLEVAPMLAELEGGTALLVSSRGANEGARYLLDRELVTVGRHPGSDIFLDDITVSRRHAQFRRSENQFWVHDVGSLNGTYVNGERAEERLLTTGDELQIGKFKLVVFVAEASATSEPT